MVLALLPQAYRGYVFSFVGDELCYYLGSRFYSPRLGRFLNADKHFDTGTGVIGTNMFAYCNNNPVMFVDPTGEDAIAVASGILVAVFTAIGLSVIISLLANEILKLLPSLDLSSIKRAIETIAEGKIQTVKLIRTFVKSLSKSMADYVELVISEALTKAKQSILNNNRYDIHHIVAKKAPAGIFGRLVLAAVGMEIEDQKNKVAIKYKLHAYLNTNSYNTGVGIFLMEVYTNASENKRRTQVENALLFLKIALLSASAIVP